MLHVGQVKFTPGEISTRGEAFLRYTYLSPRAENWKFYLRVKWIFWAFWMIFYMFSFYKNTDIPITDKMSLISYKLEKKKIAVLVMTNIVFFGRENQVDNLFSFSFLIAESQIQEFFFLFFIIRLQQRWKSVKNSLQSIYCFFSHF